MIVAAAWICGTGSKGSDHDNPDRVPVAADPMRSWACRQPEPPWRQSHGRDLVDLELGPKRLELLHELVPAATTIACLVNPTNPRNTEA